ncbi:uncharacterized protein [Nicotiana tomentosiformis]|uniref:uncharacterized protein n=1 Tax=Nicotiana tomentosiformis TaxID=4098 RepID=UPI00388C60F6
MDQEISHWHIWDDLARDFVRQFQYNVDIALDRNSLSNLKKKTMESFREYAIKWREQAARVKPPMDETEMVTVFLQDQEVDYFQNMISGMGKPFAGAIKIGEMVQNNLKTARILSQAALKATSQAIQNGSGGLANRKKREEGAVMASGSRGYRRSSDHSYMPPRTPQHYYAHQGAAYVVALPRYAARHKAVVNPTKDEKKVAPIPQAVETKTGPAPAKNVVLYVPKAPRKEQLILNIPKKFDERKAALSVPRLYVPKGTYVARGPVISRRLTEPMVISLAPQIPMKDPTAVPSNYNKTVVTYKGKEVMGEVNEMNQSRKYHIREDLKKSKLNRDKQIPSKKPVSNEEAEEFFRKMKTSEYSIVDQLRKTPSQVSLLSLVLSSDEHQKVLLKTLNEAYVRLILLSNNWKE